MTKKEWAARTAAAAAKKAGQAAASAPNVASVATAGEQAVREFWGKKWPVTYQGVYRFLENTGIVTGRAELEAFKRSGAADALKRVFSKASVETREGLYGLETLGAIHDQLSAAAGKGIATRIRTVFDLVGKKAPETLEKILGTVGLGVESGGAGLLKKGLSAIKGVGLTKGAGALALGIMGLDWMTKRRSEQSTKESESDMMLEALSKRPSPKEVGSDNLLDMLLQRRMLNDAASNGVPPGVLFPPKGSGAGQPEPLPGAVQL